MISATLQSYVQRHFQHAKYGRRRKMSRGGVCGLSGKT